MPPLQQAHRGHRETRMKPSDSGRFARLASWAQSHGASLHRDAEIYNDDVTKFSIRMRQADGVDGIDRSISPGEAIVSCPMAIAISYLNALIGRPLGGSCLDEPASPAFPDVFMDSTPPHVIGRFFLIQQYLLGRGSFWSPYIETLPQPEHVLSWCLPPFWPEDEIDFLEGTNVHAAIEQTQSNVAKEFKKARRALKELGFPGWKDYTRLLYSWAFCIFTSRSFRPSFVIPEGVKTKLQPYLPDGCRIDDFSILLPLLDIANHSPAAKVSWDTETDPGGVQFRTWDTHRPGEQLFNNYGMKTNGELLVAYGFILPETDEVHNNYFHLRKRVEHGEGQHRRTGTTDQGKPQDFVISLRPMNHPSSVVGRWRQFKSSNPHAEIASEFAHFEDALLWDLCVSLLTGTEMAALGVDEGGISEATSVEDGDTRRQILGRVFSPASPVPDFMERAKATLIEKLVTDYSRLVAEGVDEEMGKMLTPNQRLALQYNRQCGKVLAAAINALDPEAQLSREGLAEKEAT